MFTSKGKIVFCDGNFFMTCDTEQEAVDTATRNNISMPEIIAMINAIAV